MQLIEQAQRLIREGKPDEAVRTLERALNLHPTNGEAYYYLAEACLLKGNFQQAGEFHGFAVIYLRDHAQWAGRLKAQEEMIFRKSRD